MKHIFASERGKRVIIGLSVIALGITAAVTLKGLLVGGGSRWNQALFYGLVGGTVLGGLLYFFFARNGMLIGYAVAAILSFIFIIPNEWNLYTITLIAVTWFILPSVVHYVTKEKKQPNPVSSYPPTTREVAQRKAESSLNAKDAPMFAQLRTNTSIYRVMFHEGAFLFYKIRHAWRKSSADEISGTDTPPPLKSGDFSISTADVTNISFRDVEEDNSPFDQEISILANKRRYHFMTMISSGGAALEQLMREYIPTSALKETSPENRFVPAPSKKRRAVLKTVYLAICAVALLDGILWIFFDVPYRLFAWIALIPAPVLLLLYYLFSNELSIAGKKTIVQRRIPIQLGLIFSILAPALRTQVDFNLLEPRRYLITVGVAFVLVVAQAVLSSLEIRIRKGQLAVVGLVAFAYLIGAVGQVNYLMDRTPPQQYHAVVQGMGIQRYFKSHTSYLLIAETDDHKMHSLGVSKAFYEETTVGQAIVVLVYDGALGISFEEAEQQP